MQYFFEIGMLLLSTLIGIISYQSKRQSDANEKRMDAIDAKIDKINEERTTRNERVNDRFAELDKDMGESLHEIKIQLAKIVK